MGCSTILRSSCTAPLKRSTWPTWRTTPLRRAISKSARASSRVGVIGFSTSTLTPASSRSRVTAKCWSVGTATVATSTRPMRSRWSGKASVSYLRAMLVARSSSTSTTPTRSTSHSSANTRIWYCPMWPAPTTPARTRRSRVVHQGTRSLSPWSGTIDDNRRAGPQTPRRAAATNSTRWVTAGVAGRVARIVSRARAGASPLRYEHAVRILDEATLCHSHTPSAEPDHVHPARRGRNAVDDHVGRNVRRHLRAASHVGEAADADERRHAGETSDGRPVPDVNVPGEPRVVDEDNPGSETAVVGHVTHGHEQALLADFRPSLVAWWPGEW